MRLVAISSDTAEDSRALRERLRLPFPLLRDEGVAVAQAYGVADAKNGDIAVPATLIVLPSREVFWIYVGEKPPDRPDEDDVMKQLEAALAEGRPGD